MRSPLGLVDLQTCAGVLTLTVTPASSSRAPGATIIKLGLDPTGEIAGMILSTLHLAG